MKKVELALKMLIITSAIIILPTRGLAQSPGASPSYRAVAADTLVSQASPDETRFERSVSRLGTWARKIITFYSSWGDSIDRQKLADRLDEVNAAIFRYRDAKSALISGIEVQVISRDSVNVAATNLRFMLDTVRIKVLKAGELTQRAEVDGTDVAQAISDALAARQSWLDQLVQASSQTDRRDFRRLSARGRETMAMLDSAAREISRASLRLRNN